MKFSIPGYNIYDGEGRALYHGDVVLRWCGGGNDGRPYREYEYHQLYISRHGKLSLSSISNHVFTGELEKVQDIPKSARFGVRYKSYDS